jgi:uncharacterized protein YkwD
VPHPPKARLLLAITLVLICALTLPGTANAGLSKSEKKLYRVVNDVRHDHGSRQLRIGSWIQRSAHKWAGYLRAHDAFYHGRLRAGIAENIAWVTCRRGWARALTRMWLASSSHRPHLLGGAHRIGVGVSTGSWSGYGCVRMAVTRFR